MEMDMDPRQEAALELLGMGVNKKKTAEALKVSARTLRRWCAEPQFKAALNDAATVSRLVVHAQLANQVGATVRQHKNALKCLAGGISGQRVDVTQIRCAQAVMNHFGRFALAFIKEDTRRLEREQRNHVPSTKIPLDEPEEEAPAEISAEPQTSQTSQTSHSVAVEKRPKADTPVPIADDSPKPEERLTLAQRMAERVRQRNLQKLAERAAKTGHAQASPV